MFKKHEQKLEQLVPNGTDEIVHIEDIIIPPDFVKRPPRGKKVQFALNYLRKNGVLDKPISVLPETNERGFINTLVLFDEYTRYLAAKMTGMKLVPIKYI